MREKRYYMSGDVIFKEGDLENWMYVILSGSVGIYENYDQAPRLLTNLSSSHFFGEMGMIEHKVRTATAIAISEVTVERIDEEDFLEALKNEPKMINMLLGSISNRIAVLSKDYVEACETISEYIRLEKTGDQKSKAMIEKMKRIIAVSERE